MKEQIKDINGFFKQAILEHQYFLNHMGQWVKGGEQHHDSEGDKDCI
jgi:hypothetical protein